MIRSYLIAVLSLACTCFFESSAKSQSNEVWDLINQLQSVRNCASNDYICKELEISKDQRLKLAKVFEKYEIEQRQKIRELAALPRLKPGATIEEMAARSKKGLAISRKPMDTAFSKMNETLLPHQMKRLKQIANQLSLSFPYRFHGMLGAVDSYRDKLGLNETQKTQVSEQTKKIQKEYVEELRKLKEKYYRKTLEPLSETQRKQMSELVGELFDFETSDRVAAQSRISKRVKRHSSKSSK